MPATRFGQSSGTSELLSIGELAEQAGVATSALRYYEDLGLVRPATRTSGRRRYALAAVAEVGVIRFLRETGFSLAEIGAFLEATDRRTRQTIIDRKLVEFAEQQHRLDVARTLLEHGRRCPASEPMHCSRFRAIIDGHLRGLSVEDSHALVH
jgi:DNA-binding transcriptional MerR regulator